MALTIADAARLSNDLVVKGVMEEIIYDSPLMQRLPWIEINGNALTYNRENAAATAAFYAVGDTWTESTPTFTQITATLTILGGDADVDEYIRKTRSNVQDIEAAIIQLKAKAVRNKLEDTLINGDGTSNSFVGIDLLCAAGQTVSSGANGATLTTAFLDQLIDQVEGGKPDLLLMSKRSRRKLKQLRASSGNILETDRNQFGEMVTFYDGIQIAVSDWISDNKTVGTSSDCSTIYAFRMGEDALAGLVGGAPPNQIIQIQRLGPLETKDADRTRIKAYVSLALFSTKALAKLTGVRD